MSDLSRKAVTAALWAALGSWSSRLSAIVVFVALSRSLDAADFGLIALAFPFILLSSALVEAGLSRAVVQFSEIRRRDIDTAFSLTVIFAGLATVALFFSAQPVAGLLGEPRLEQVIKFLSLSPLFGALQFVPAALLERVFAFKVLAVRRLLGTLGGGAVALVLALSGAGVWALVAQNLVVDVIGVAVMWLAPAAVRPRVRVSLSNGRRLLRFGAPALGNACLGFLAGHSDKVIVGATLGASTLGFYVVGSRVAAVVLEVVAVVFSSVSLSLFSRLQDEPLGLRRAYLRAVSASTVTSAPFFCGIAATAPLIVGVVFGARWEPAVGVLRGLAIGALFVSVSYFDSTLLQAVNRPGASFALAGLNAVAVIGAAAGGVRWGLVGVAYSLAAVNLCLWPIRLVIVRNITGISPQSTLAAWLRPTLAAAIMTIPVVMVQRFLNIGNGSQLVISVVLGVFCYIALLRVIARDAADALWSHLRGLRRPPPLM